MNHIGTLVLGGVTLAASSLAQAQASVNLYGRINTTVESQKVGDGDRKTVVQNNSSRLGARGSEDLGGGLKASFVLEHGLASDTGAASGGTTFWSRQASIELSGGFGAVRLGRWFPGSYFATADYISNHNHDTGTSSDALYAFGDFPSTNKVAYFTPSMGGWQGELSVSLGEGATKTATDLALNYQQGPLHGGFGYQEKGDFSQFAVRGMYEFGPLILGAYLQRAEDKFGAAGKKSWNVYRLSGMYVMGASEFHLNFGKADKRVGDDAANQATVGYNYNLSKRTKVYGFYTKIDDGKANAYGGDFSSFAVGVRHNF